MKFLSGVEHPDLHQKTVMMDFDVHELIWFKFGMMIDTIELYMLMLVLLTLTIIEGHRSMRKQKLPRQLSR